MDLIDMRSSPNDADMNFIFHAMDHFTKIHIIRPIRRKEAACVAECLMTSVFPVYGLPRILQMDNGKEFVNKTIAKIVEDWPGSCTIINGRPRHPQSQGLIEQANGTVEGQLRALREDIGPSFQWPDHIPYIQFVINTSLQHAIRMSPYEAVYGKKPNLSSIFGVEDVDGVQPIIQEEDLADELFERSERATSEEVTSEGTTSESTILIQLPLNLSHHSNQNLQLLR